MKKKLSLVIITVLVLISLALLLSISKKIVDRVLISSKLSKLPNIHLYSTQGEVYQLQDLADDRITVLIYFQSECSYCETEALEVQKYSKELEAANIIFISVESLEHIAAFEDKYDFKSYENIFITQARLSELATFFGNLHTPQIFIYDSRGRLIRTQKGQVLGKTLVSWINNES